VDRARIDAEVERVLDDVVAFTLASPRPEPADALEFLYASGPGSRAVV
jgi:pyruvate dehydrogenase E1 component alpha subunit